jgi:flagellar hook-associated protein 3 FlgL
MAVRFTNDVLSRQTLFDLGNITEKLSKTQEQLSSGKRITAPEDDPYGSGRAVTLRNQLADVQQYQVNINDASAWAQQTDSSLGNVTDLLQRARELTVQAANGTQNQDSLNAISSEMTQIKASLSAEANSTYNGRYIFSGTATSTPPYPTNAYAGNALPVQRLIAPGEIVAVNTDGPSAFGTQAAGPPATKNVFDVMDDIIGALNSGNMTTLQSTSLTELDGSLTTALNARTTVGAISNRLDTQSTRMSGQELSVTDLLSKTEDADMAKTLITYSQTQTAYQAALQAGAKIIQPTLMDFLTSP